MNMQVKSTMYQIEGSYTHWQLVDAEELHQFWHIPNSTL